MHSYSKRTDIQARLTTLAALTQSQRQRQRLAVPPRSLRFRMTDEQRGELVADYEAGVATTKLTVDYRLAKGSVLGLLQEAGVSLRRQGLNAEETAQARLLYESGLSLAGVGERLGLAPTSVSRALVKSGLRLRLGRRQ